MHAPSSDHGLSPRELVTLRLVALGYTNPEIAERVGSSLRTVESQRAAIRQKLDARTRADLVRFALDNGLLEDREPPDTEPGDIEPRDTEPGDIEPRDVEPRDVEPRDTEPRHTEPRHTEPGNG